MAQCEKCSKGGYDPKEMDVDPVNRIFLGPCCSSKNSFNPAKLNYGIELSNRQGILAYLEYEGLVVQYHKTPKEISSWFQKTSIPSFQKPKIVKAS